MAILFCGVVMSHYTHLNLSPVAQISTQLTFRTIAFMAGRFSSIHAFMTDRFRSIQNCLFHYVLVCNYLHNDK